MAEARKEAAVTRAEAQSLKGGAADVERLRQQVR